VLVSIRDLPFVAEAPEQEEQRRPSRIDENSTVRPDGGKDDEQSLSTGTVPGRRIEGTPRCRSVLRFVGRDGFSGVSYARATRSRRSLLQ
jgi:hypothetical protein